MRKIVVALVMALAVLIPAVPAHAADNCVTRAEYSQIRTDMTRPQVNVRVGFSGTVIGSHTDSYQLPGDPRVVMRDLVVAYPRCASWGKGNVGVNFDDYSSPKDDGKFRVVLFQTSNARSLIFWK